MERITVEYQLGQYIGEYIFMKYLPTLSTDMLTTRNIIVVSLFDTEKHNCLTEKWLISKTQEDWDNLQNNYKILVEKYLPKELFCHIPKLDVDNMEELLNGLIDNLWDCDICHYSLDKEDIEINNSERWDTEIKFKLD